MTLKSGAVWIGSLLLILGLAATAQAGKYHLVGGGGQLQIGGGLPLPIQIVNTTGSGGLTATGTNPPPLLVPVAPHPVGSPAVLETVTPKSLKIPANVLSKAGVQTTLGQFDNNPNLYAVGTNINYKWPSAAVTLNKVNRLGTENAIYNPSPGLFLSYSQAVGAKFGGPARFALTGGLGTGALPGAPVTVYAIAVPGAGNPPCAYAGGANPACLAALVQATPNSLAAAGGPTSNFVSTPGAVPSGLNVHIGSFGPGPSPPKGTVLTLGPGVASGGAPNLASSWGYPWTTGKIIMSATTASGTAEKFSITGKDTTSSGGIRTIQFVGGAVSLRAVTGPNANRAWVSLKLRPISDSPALSPIAQLSVGALMLLGGGYVLRRRMVAGGTPA